VLKILNSQQYQIFAINFEAFSARSRKKSEEKVFRVEMRFLMLEIFRRERRRKFDEIFRGIFDAVCDFNGRWSWNLIFIAVFEEKKFKVKF
jgi:hypothetical protein